MQFLPHRLEFVQSAERCHKNYLYWRKTLETKLGSLRTHQPSTKPGYCIATPQQPPTTPVTASLNTVRLFSIFLCDIDFCFLKWLDSIQLKNSDWPFGKLFFFARCALCSSILLILPQKLPLTLQQFNISTLALGCALKLFPVDRLFVPLSLVSAQSLSLSRSLWSVTQRWDVVKISFPASGH